ncbi:gliding motility protein SprC [Flavobacterium sp. MC2016-06]|uniref:gliding motility protein SprC n=1 Tax=Flavobacterium sp. MC2016-06 TaxID=2676308 RepID=UPI0012BB0DC4|nr:gliding motility protein SprC [Flavobacterium sp. MC2016-06]MBU3862359.1 gliding motility protein SprC [Flavobacterium sp. MC2016-06]
MIQKTTLSAYRFILFFSIVFFTKTSTHAQTIVPQQLNFERICAGLIIDGAPFNEYTVTFSYVDFPAGTTFAVELSNDAGSFTTPTATTTIGTPVDDPVLKQQTIKFAVPTNLKGSNVYSLRVKSNTTPAVNSLSFKNLSNSTSFAAYYSTYVSSFFINDKMPTATICAGGSVSLSVYNPTPNDQASSPANYSNLKYKWFKDDVLITGQSGTTLVANATGTYYAQLDYGLCSEDNLSSNRVSVTSSSSGSAVTVTSSLGNPFCASGAGTILTATSGNSYVWRKDGVLISGATSRSYSANESGLYTVEVNFGGCTGTGTIDLKSNSFSASIDAPDEYELKDGETLSVSITTDATTPTYEWYLNNNLISGATTGNYLVAVRGNYKVIISQSSGCISTKEFSFKVTSQSDSNATVIPNIIKLSGLNPYWNIPDVYKNDTTKVLIISSNGDKVLDVVNYQGDWPQSSIEFKNVNPVYYYVIQGDAGEKKGSITVIK